MFDLIPTFINEEFFSNSVSPEQIDQLLAEGWRHFGTHFFRYDLGLYRSDIRRVIPLRVRLSDFTLSKRQRRILSKNAGLKTVIRPIEITAGTEALFDRHKKRFKEGVPSSIYDFLSQNPANIPCEAKEVCVFNEETLLAVSYFDVGERSVSSIYGMFEPAETAGSLGIFTMLKEIEFAIDNDKEFYYQGYCYEGESFYDYKKRFSGIEQYDWNGNWEIKV